MLLVGLEMWDDFQVQFIDFSSTEQISISIPYEEFKCCFFLQKFLLSPQKWKIIILIELFNK